MLVIRYSSEKTYKVKRKNVYIIKRYKVLGKVLIPVFKT